MRSRETGQSLTLSRLSYVSTVLPVYPAGVRGVDLKFKGADVILLSLNGFKLVVTRLASPATIGFVDRVAAGICADICATCQS